MSGPDAVRGITFQHAVAIQTCIEALGDHQVASIRFEGSNDILDLEALDQSGTLVWAKQMRTRQEPYAWTRREIAGVIRAWFDTNPPRSARFTFITDGQFGPSADELRNEIQAAIPSGQVDPGTLKELNAPDRSSCSQTRTTAQPPAASC